MKNFSLIRLFTYNWQIKLVCLLIAIAFWTYISSIGVRAGEFPGGIELELKNIPEGMVAITDVNTVDLKIVAEQNVWNRLTSESVKAYVDLAGLTAGTHDETVQIQINIEGVEVEDYSPKQALIRLEPKVTKTVPVNVKIEGEAASGMVSGVPIIEPEEVQISGAESIIGKILEANAVVRLDGESEDVSKTVKLSALNADNEKINGVSFSPEEVNVTIPIVKAESTKTVGIKVLTNGSVSSGYWISDLSTTPSEVTITGSSSALKSVDYIATKKINIDNLSSNLSTTAELSVPSGVSLVDQVNSIKVNFVVSQSDTNKLLNAKIETKNLPSNLILQSITPNNIAVNVSGSADVLKSVTSGNVILNIDLSKYTSSGVYNMDITNDMFSLKDGVNILSYTPSSLTIELTNK